MSSQYLRGLLRPRRFGCTIRIAISTGRHLVTVKYDNPIMKPSDLLSSPWRLRLGTIAGSPLRGTRGRSGLRLNGGDRYTNLAAKRGEARGIKTHSQPSRRTFTRWKQGIRDTALWNSYYIRKTSRRWAPSCRAHDRYTNLAAGLPRRQRTL